MALVDLEQNILHARIDLAVDGIYVDYNRQSFHPGYNDISDLSVNHSMMYQIFVVLNNSRKYPN